MRVEAPDGGATTNDSFILRSLFPGVLPVLVSTKASDSFTQFDSPFYKALVTYEAG